MICEKRKDFNASGSQGSFKRNRNGSGNFKGISGKDFNGKAQSERSYNCRRCNKNHPGKDDKGELVTCHYC